MAENEAETRGVDNLLKFGAWIANYQWIEYNSLCIVRPFGGL